MASNSKATTLFNLKEEYLAAKHSTRTPAAGTNTHKKLKDIIHYTPRDVTKLKNKKQREREARERRRAARLALTEQEQEDLARSRSVLEAKTAVYDKLLRHKGDTSENVLVDFSQKRADREDDDQEGPSVEISYDYDNPAPRPYHEHHQPDLGPDEVHLSNVDKGEVRSKGVGFYTFSTDSQTRKQQMEFLNSMRESTERSRELYRVAKEKKRQQKIERLNRLRKRLNLAPIDRLPGEKEPVEEAPVESETVPTESDPAPAQPDPVKSLEEKFLVRERSMWERKVEELRGEREMEFAPRYGGEEEEEELGEEDEAIVNFISFVRHNT